MDHVQLPYNDTASQEVHAISVADLPIATSRECGTRLGHGGGTYLGHTGPGLVFLAWGLWWAVHMFWTHFRHIAANLPHCSGGHFPALCVAPSRAAGLRHLEAWMKALGPFFMVFLELKGDHKVYQCVLQQRAAHLVTVTSCTTPWSTQSCKGCAANALAVSPCCCLPSSMRFPSTRSFSRTRRMVACSVQELAV